MCQDKSFLNDHLLTGPSLCIYLSYISAIPILFTAEQEKCQVKKTSAPLGLILIPKFIREAEEIVLLKFFGFANGDNDPVSCSEPSDVLLARRELKHRNVIHYGYEFNYTTNNVDPAKPLPSGLPEVCAQIITRMMHDNLVVHKPDQLTVNQYLPGQGNNMFNIFPFCS